MIEAGQVGRSPYFQLKDKLFERIHLLELSSRNLSLKQYVSELDAISVSLRLLPQNVSNLVEMIDVYCFFRMVLPMIQLLINWCHQKMMEIRLIISNMSKIEIYRQF